MSNRILGDEEIKKIIYNAHVERSKMFHGLIKFILSEVKNLVMKPVTASQKYTAVHH